MRRFAEGESIEKSLIIMYVLEAFDNQRQGRIVKPENLMFLSVPCDLELAFNSNPKLNAAFENLAPYKKREYAELLSSAKREETRARRLEKIIPMILAGKGLNDRYRC